MRIIHFAFPFLLPGTAACAGAQRDTGMVIADSIAWRNDCRLATQVLVHGQTAQKRPWALGIIPDCGTAGADALAHAVREGRHAQVRTSDLDALAHAASDVIDGEIYRAAREVAADPSASEAARVHALGIWYAQVTGGDLLPYEALVTRPATGADLVLGPVTTVRPLTLRPLPPDALEASIRALTALAGHESNPRVSLAIREVMGSFEFSRDEAGF